MSEHHEHHANHHNKSNDLVGILEPYFAKLPALPKNAKETLVKVMPWIALIFGILGVVGAISGLGLLGVTSPLALFGGVEGVASYGTGMIAALFWLVSSALMLAAYPGLKNHQLKGWNLLYWSEVVNIVGAVVSISGILNGVIWGIVGFYILYQIKSHYK